MTRSAPVDLARLVRYEPVESGMRYVVGSGCGAQGQRGVVIGILSLKSASSYEVVLHLDCGDVRAFSPMRLFPELAPA